MTAVAPGNSTVAFIRQKVRRLTASSSESELPTAALDEYINNFYNNDFPYGIKIDQQKIVYTFYTEPFRDRYPLDVNYCQGVRPPFYVDGILGTLFKDRQQFFNLWPRWPTRFQIGPSALSGTITGATNAVQCQITSANHNLTVGAVITIDGVVGMTQLNGLSFTVFNIVDPNNFTINVDSTAFGVYVSGGTWIATLQTFAFVIPGPFLTQQVTIGGVDQSGNPITINDDGSGILQYLTPNAVTTVPNQTQSPTAPIPGILNKNTGNPGLISPLNIGTVNYVSGQINFTLPSGVSLAPGTLFTIRVSQYQPGRPYCLMFWNNEFVIRPIPKFIHKIEVEVYMTPVQFMAATDLPILSQWSQYLAYGASMEILRDRQDLEGVENLREGFMRQEALVLERQGIEEIGTPNYQLFNSTQAFTVYGGYSQGYY